MTIRLTFPNRSHEVSDLKPFYEEFKLLHPITFERWKSLERDWSGNLTEEIFQIGLQVTEFLKTRVEWDSHAALSSAFGDFRKLLMAEMWMN